MIQSSAARFEVPSWKRKRFIGALRPFGKIGIKHSLGRADFEMKAGWEKKIPAELQKSGIQRLDVEPSHCGAVSTLPLHHRDPFDRMLVAQAISEDLTLVTRDPFVRAYPIRWVW